MNWEITDSEIIIYQNVEDSKVIIPKQAIADAWNKWIITSILEELSKIKEYTPEETKEIIERLETSIKNKQTNGTTSAKLQDVFNKWKEELS